MGTIIITGIRELGVHGVLPEEQSRPQPFEVDVELEVDLVTAGQSDNLDDTVDYSAVSEAVSRVVKNERYQLLERLATRIGEVCRTDDRVKRATVTVRKLHPPVRAMLEHVAVRVDGVTRAYLGLGSNLGDRLAHLQLAVDALAGASGVDVVSVSPVYETAPVGGPERDDFLNAVVCVDTELSPRDLLALAQDIERTAERVRTVRWGPRTLDVDVLLFGDERVSEPDLEIPHPRLAERAFVLAPLHDVAPDLAERPPDGGEGVNRTPLALRLP